MTEPDTSETSPSVPYRGDFMLLPPLLPTFGTPAMIQQTPKDFLVTRRPTAVADTELVHSLDVQLTGRVRSRARRRLRPAAPELEHLISPAEVDEDAIEESPSSSLPSPTRPRTLRAQPRGAARPPASSSPASLPSRD
ncbi:MAG TPA: hypothetical protein DCQ36_12450, partial [Actinobacteria bacterium]|nr:hypothetical protein [Actinomycetota bacterium]